MLYDVDDTLGEIFMRNKNDENFVRGLFAFCTLLSAFSMSLAEDDPFYKCKSELYHCYQK